MTAEDHVHTGAHQYLQEVAGVGDRAALTSRSRNGEQMVMEGEDLELRRDRELLADPVVALPPDLPLAPFDLEELRAYRARETWGNAYRRPRCYAPLVSSDVQQPFVRKDARR